MSAKTYLHVTITVPTALLVFMPNPFKVFSTSSFPADGVSNFIICSCLKTPGLSPALPNRGMLLIRNLSKKELF